MSDAFLPPEPAPSGGGRRKARLESLLRREIATAVTSEMRDPRLGFVTITRVELTGDLAECTAFYTVFGTASKRKLTQEALNSARPFLQRKYAKAVRLRRLPMLRFSYDEGDEQQQALDAALRKVRAEQAEHDTDGDGAEPANDSDDG